MPLYAGWTRHKGAGRSTVCNRITNLQAYYKYKMAGFRWSFVAFNRSCLITCIAYIRGCAQRTSARGDAWSLCICGQMRTRGRGDELCRRGYTIGDAGDASPLTSYTAIAIYLGWIYWVYSSQAIPRKYFWSARHEILPMSMTVMTPAVGKLFWPNRMLPTRQLA